MLVNGREERKPKKRYAKKRERSAFNERGRGLDSFMIPTSIDIVALRPRANYSNIQSFDSAPFFSSIFPKGESIEDETG